MRLCVSLRGNYMAEKGYHYVCVCGSNGVLVFSSYVCISFSPFPENCSKCEEEVGRTEKKEGKRVFCRMMRKKEG